jgi:hypothetical protein
VPFRQPGTIQDYAALRLPNTERAVDQTAIVMLHHHLLGDDAYIDQLLAAFSLTRDELADQEKVAAAVRAMAARMPTYITLKDVKKRWGKGQEDIFPVTQFEKLWGDMTALPELDCRFLVVSRMRGQQLKDVAQLDGWLRDGSAAYVESLCDWE